MSESDDVYRVRFDRRNAFVAPLVFQGEQADWTTADIVDFLANDPRTASRVAGLLWTHLVGSRLDSAAADELGRWWTGQNLAIDPLVERIVTSDQFWSSVYTRPRTGLEWFNLVASATDTEQDVWLLKQLHQMPYLPPTPAGWNDEQWLLPSSLAGRSSVLHSVDWTNLAERHGELSIDESVNEIIDRCGLHPVSAETVAALKAIVPDDSVGAGDAATVRWRLALSSPEANLS